MNIPDLLKQYSKEIITLVGTIFVWVLNTHLRPRAKLLQTVRHSSSMLIKEIALDETGKPILGPDGQPTQVSKLVRIAQVSFINGGREPATELQVTFNWRPQHMSIWPHRHYTEQVAPDDRFTVSVGTLPPKEFIAFDLLAVEGNLPEITSAHCKECSARLVPTQPQEVHPRWKIGILLYFAIAGIAASIYATASIIQWVAGR